MKNYSKLTATALCGLLCFASIDAIAEIKPRNSRDRQAEIITELSAQGKQLEASYSSRMESLANEIQASVPQLSEAQRVASSVALAKLKKAYLEFKQAEKTLDKNQSALHGVERARGEAKVAPLRLENAKEMLEWAEELPDAYEGKAEKVKGAASQIKKRQSDVDKVDKAIEKAMASPEKARQALPEIQQAYKKSLAAYHQSVADAVKTLDGLGVDMVLSSDALDAKLAQFKIISDATPRSLAQFGQQSPAHAKLINDLFADNELMLEMVYADGAIWGKYGKAMEIYQAIQQASPKAKEGILQRVALATSLVHAVPMTQRNADADTNAPEYVDPVKRYLSYEKWYENGELDPYFKDLNVWELKMVVNQKDPDEMMEWVRDALSSFRPDYLTIDHKKGRYISFVHSDIGYTREWDNDLPEYHFFQNIMANFGICGRRAFFGRFLLRSYGIPAIRRKQPGHATLAHWTPDGWQTRLGGNWGGKGSVPIAGSGSHNFNFYEMAKARENASEFIKVKRAQWIGDVMGEDNCFYGIFGSGGKNNKSLRTDRRSSVEGYDSWYAVSFMEQAKIVTELEAKPAASGKPFYDALHYSHYIEPDLYEPTAADKKVAADRSGTITIPAGAFALPEVNLAKSGEMSVHQPIRFLQSKLGGAQLYYGRYTPGMRVKTTFNVPKEGRYQLASKVVAPHPNLALSIICNDAKKQKLKLPYTVGLWDTTAPITVELKQGANTLSFKRTYDDSRGVSLHHFTLTPVN